MKINQESFGKFALIGLSLFLFKAVLIVFAYLLNQEQYNLFNQSYYTSSVLILFGSLGFNIAQTRLPVNTGKLFALVSINSVLAFIVLHIISNPFSEIADIIPVIIYSIFISVSGVLNFKILFTGNYKKYFYILFSLAIVHLSAIPIVKIFNLQIFPVLSLLIILWFIVVYRFFDSEAGSKNNTDKYYKIGFSAFIINSAVSLGLAGDKFVANHFFAAEIANAYTFAWSLTAPIFYIGTLIEKYLYAEQNPSKNKILKNGFFLSVIFVTGYSVFVITTVNLFSDLLPDSVSEEILKSILTIMITGYAIYVVFHFPLNTYLFKVIDTARQKTISVYFSFIILIFTGVFYYLVNIRVSLDYKTLLSFVWLYIFTLLIIKAIVIFRKKHYGDNKSDETIT